MQIWNIANKDLLQIFHDRRTLFFLILMPVIFTVFLGLLMSGNGTTSQSQLSLGIVDLDQGSVLSEALNQSLQSSARLHLVEVGSQEVNQAHNQVSAGTFSGLLTIPQGFSSQVLNGSVIPVSLTIDPNNPNGRALEAEVSATLARVNAMVETARISASQFASLQPFSSQAAMVAYLSQAVTVASTSWKNAPLSLAAVTAGNAKPASNPYSQSSPGMIVQFSIYGLMFAGGILVTERNNHTHERLLTMPVAGWEIIAGHVVSTFLVILAQETLLIAFGQLIFKVDYLSEPAATLLMMVAVAIWGASLGLLIGVVSKHEEHVVLWSLVAMFLLAGMGGAWFPLDVTGQTFSTIGHLLPSAWAMDGFQNIILRGLGFPSVLLPAGLLLAYTGLFFGIAIWRMRKV